MMETNEIYQSFYTIDMYKKSKVFQRTMGKQGLGQFLSMNNSMSSITSGTLENPKFGIL